LDGTDHLALMATVQFMCARIRMMTGRGLAGAFHHKLPRPLIAIAACALFVANTINVGADLRGWLMPRNVHRP
jgi:Mn2+/Fe2+ NRAMP family transporter